MTQNLVAFETWRRQRVERSLLANLDATISALERLRATDPKRFKAVIRAINAGDAPAKKKGGQ